MAAGPKLEQYKQLIRNLFPKGKIWDFLNQPNLSKLLDISAIEFCRVDDRIEDYLRELDPRQATDAGLLPDWERMLGLPDECSEEVQTEQQRRDQVVQKLTTQGALSGNFYEFIATQLGFPNTIVTDWRPFEVGRSVVGERLTNDFDIRFTVGQSVVGDTLRIWGWRFLFNVQTDLTLDESFRVGQNTVGEPLRVFGNPIVECTIKKLKGAHMGVTFNFI